MKQEVSFYKPESENLCDVCHVHAHGGTQALSISIDSKIIIGKKYQ